MQSYSAAVLLFCSAAIVSQSQYLFFQPYCAHNIMIHITQKSLTWFGVRRVSGHAFFPLIKGVCAHRTGQRMPTTQFLKKGQMWRFHFWLPAVFHRRRACVHVCVCAHSFLEPTPIDKVIG